MESEVTATFAARDNIVVVVVDFRDAVVDLSDVAVDYEKGEEAIVGKKSDLDIVAPVYKVVVVV